ncbi:MAG TPA: Hsp70 family protein [Kofleriaceae bacterium]|nr:Hsp70 family protein [Kofleriaceae bacterium]
MKPRTIGIDLGTTNSCVATIDDDGFPRIITNQQGETTTPSMVSVDIADDGTVRPIIGTPARRRAVTNPADTVFAVKRLMGRRFDDPEVKRLAPTLPYPVVPAPNGDAWVSLQGELMAPEQVSALVLAELRQVAETFFDGEVGEAIITVPAYFDNAQRQATKDAAEIAGLSVRRLLNEPTAAAMGYGAHRGADQRMAICDLGGGTFDVSIVNVEDGVFEVISTHGDAFLGGDDFDRAIIDELLGDVQRQHGLDVASDPQALQRLKGEVQDIKHLLSETREATLNLPFLGRTAAGASIDYERVLRRDQLEAWTRPIIDRLIAPCREAVARCGLEPSDVDAVILVGGMTRMPAVQRQIATIFGKQPLKVVNPDEIVSVGAATQVALLDGRFEGVVLLDVTSRALGIQVGGGRYMQVIPRNATIPTREHKIIATTRDGQRSLEFDVYEGESAEARLNRHLGRYACVGLPEAPAGEVLILVDLTVDVDGILHLAVSELGSGERPELHLVASAGLTRATVRTLRQSMAGLR